MFLFSAFMHMSLTNRIIKKKKIKTNKRTFRNSRANALFLMRLLNFNSAKNEKKREKQKMLNVKEIDGNIGK